MKVAKLVVATLLASVSISSADVPVRAKCKKVADGTLPSKPRIHPQSKPLDELFAEMQQLMRTEPDENENPCRPRA